MRYIDVPAESRAEQLVAGVILANIDLLQKTIDEAKLLITDALDIAELLFYHGVEYRAQYVSKFACFTYDYEGVRETLPLPIIRDMLVVPAINLPEVVVNLRKSIHKMLNLEDVSIRYYRLQFKTKEMINALQAARKATTREELAGIIADILRESLKDEKPPANPLDVAADYFALARNLMSKGNVTLTRIALRKAEKPLETFGKMETSAGNLQRIHTLKSELKAISEAV